MFTLACNYLIVLANLSEFLIQLILVFLCVITSLIKQDINQTMSLNETFIKFSTNLYLFTESLVLIVIKYNLMKMERNDYL